MGKGTKKETGQEVPMVIQDAGEVMDTIAGMTDDTEAMIYLYRIPEAGRSRYLTKMEKDTFDLDAVRQQYGGGRFKYVITLGGVNQFQASFEVEGEPIVSSVYKTTNPTVVGKQPPQPSPYSSNTEEERLKRLEDKLDAMASRPSSNPLDPLLSKLLGTILEKAMGSGEDLEKKILDRMGIYKDLFGGQDSTQLTAEVIQGLMNKGIEIAQANSGEGGTPWTLILEKVSPIVQELAKALAQTTGKARVVNPTGTPTGTPTGRPPHPLEPEWVRNPTPTPAEKDITPSAQPAPPTETPFWTPGFEKVAPMLKAYLPGMFASASANADPEKWSDIILDFLPESSEPAVLAWLKHNAWFRDLAILEPQIIGQMAWWEDLRGMLIAELSTPPEGSGGEPAVIDSDKLTQNENL